MIFRKRAKMLTALLLSLILALGTPITTLAVEPEAPETIQSETSSEDAAQAPEQADAPESAPEAGPAEELSSGAPASDALDPQDAGSDEESASEPASDTDEPAVLSDDTTPAAYAEVHLSGSAETGAVAAPATGQKESSPVDAEKYMEAGYDENLCWAATAANMVWMGGYAQNAVNPLTNENFRNEDEVFDFFRKSFTDVAGDPYYGIQYFIDGTYALQGGPNLSQLKDTAPEGGLLPGAINDSTLYFIGDGDIVSSLGDIADKTVGAWLRWWNTTTESFYPSAHWLTVADLVRSDDGSGFTGIWLIDSDNDPVTDTAQRGSTDSEKAALAASMPNTKTYFPLSHELIDGKRQWVITGYQSNDIKTIIGVFLVLMNMYNDQEPESDDSDDHDDNEYQDSDVQDDGDQDDDDPDDGDIIINNDKAVDYSKLSDQEVFELVISEIKTVMAENGLDVLSPTGNIYDPESGVGYSLIVRSPFTFFSNVYVNGVRISENGEFYKITRSPKGLFMITFSPEFLKSLGKGKHTISIQLNNGMVITTEVTVK
ncbi:MAG: hypothetical protein K6E90_06970 [Lachnospiraceae bacterium]|nr:hypothetical protein [Lachnospiraceae bacterium]